MMCRTTYLRTLFMLVIVCSWQTVIADTPEPVPAAPAYPTPPSYLQLLSDTDWRGTINTNMYLQRCISKELRARFLKHAVEEMKPGDGGVVLLVEFGPSKTDEAEQEEREEESRRASSSSRQKSRPSENESHHMSSMAVRVTQPGMIRRDEGQRDSYLHFLPLTRSELLSLPSTQRYSLPTTIAQSVCVLWSVTDDEEGNSSSQRLKITWAVLDQATTDAPHAEESGTPSESASTAVSQSCLKATFSLALPPHIPSCPSAISPQNFFTPPPMNSSEKEKDKTKPTTTNDPTAKRAEEVFQTMIKLSLVGDVIRMPRPASFVPLLVFAVLLFGLCCVVLFVYRSRSLTSYDFTHLRMRTSRENEGVELIDEGSMQFTQTSSLSASQRSSSRNSSRSSISKMDTVIESDYEDEEARAMVDKEDLDRL